MIQGDEPCLEPKMINQVVNVIKKNKKIKISNLYTIMNSQEEILDPNRVKVVVDKKNNAIYFSREKISTKKIKGKKIYYKQGNVFCFTKKSLNNFVKLQESFTVQSFHGVLGRLIKIELLLETQFCKKNIIFIINFDLTLNMMSL